MPTIILKSQKVSGNATPPGYIGSLTTEAQVNQYIAGNDVVVDVANCSEAQLRAIHHYVRAIALGTNTGAVETAISGVI